MFQKRTLLAAVVLFGVAHSTVEAQTATDAPTAETPATDPVTPDVPSEESNIAEARRRYAQGSEFYRRGRFAEAVAELTEAYSLWSNPTILYALAQAYEGGSEIDRAIETYERYLAEAPDDDVRHGDVVATIGVLRGLLATLHIRTNVPARVFVDGEERGEAPGDVSVATGRHTIELHAEGYLTQSEVITIAGGTDRNLSFELEEVATQVVVARERFRFPRPVFFTAAALTGASLITWGAMGSVAVHRARAYNDTSGSTTYDREDARAIARDSNVALVVTGGLAATTTIIGVLTRWGSDDDAPAEPAPIATVVPVERGALLVVGGSL